MEGPKHLDEQIEETQAVKFESTIEENDIEEPDAFFRLLNVETAAHASLTSATGATGPDGQWPTAGVSKALVRDTPKPLEIQRARLEFACPIYDYQVLKFGLVNTSAFRGLISVQGSL